MKNIFLFTIVFFVIFVQIRTIKAECTCGVVAGIASADGRPIAWKNRDWDFAYQGVSCVSTGKFKFIGIGNAGASCMMGLNSEGLALGNSTVSDLNVSGGDNVTPMHWLLQNLSTVDQCDTAFDEATRGIANHYNNGTSGHPTFTLPIIGKDGKGLYVEVGSQTKVTNENGVLVPAYFKYDPLDCGPTLVRKYAVVVRANSTHKNSGGHDDQTTGGNRYYEARDHLHNAVIRNGIFDTDPLDARGIAVDEMFEAARFGNPGYDDKNCRDMTLCTMIAHGINNGEDPKIAVMWAAVYNPDYTPFVPVWVEQGVKNEIPTRIQNGSDAQRIPYQAHRLYPKKDANNYDQYINARIKPMEANFIQAVTDARQRWVSKGFVYSEAKRISDEAVETSYATLKTIADQAQTSPRNLNKTPLITEITAQVQNTSVSFSHNASDSDGTIQSAYWEFGDSQTSTQASPTHNYSSDSTYLVMCRVTDNSGSRNSRWKYVTVGGVSIASANNTAPSTLLTCTPSGRNIAFTVQLDGAGDYSLSLYNLKGQQFWSHNARSANSGAFKVLWSYNDSQLNNDVYIARLIHNRKQSICKFTVVR